MFPVTLWFNGDMRFSILILLATLFLSACAAQPTPTPFRPPTQVAPTAPLPTLTPVPSIYVPPPTATFTSTPIGPCTNNLQFVSDLTIEDGTVVSAGSSIDKQWLVQNSGTCNWDSSYRLKWIGGDPLGANQEQAIYPARAGTQATLRIIFTAPAFAGIFDSSWQAVSPDGNLFGDSIYIKVVVQ
jgi:hypothetical protein